MDFGNVNELIDAMNKYYETHDILKLDLSEFDSFEVKEDLDPRLKALTDKDKHGEYLGRYYHSCKESSQDPSVPVKITVYLTPSDRPAAVWSKIGGLVNSYEIFEHHEDYFTGACYMVMGTMVNELHFTYYVLTDGRVSRMYSINGGPLAGGKPVVSEYEFDYDGDTTVLKSAYNVIYEQKDDGSYEIHRKDDLLIPPKREKKIGGKAPRIDNQSKLAQKLADKVNDSMSLNEIVDAFFEVVSKAKPVPDAELEYYVGPTMVPCQFILTRITPNGSGEYYQLALEVEFDIPEGQKIPDDHMIRDDADESLKEYVLDSEAYKALKNRKVTYVQVYVDET